MNNAESNPTQLQQKEIQAQTPSETPATETARADAQVMAKDHAGKKSPPTSYANNESAPLPEIDVDSVTAQSADPIERAQSRIVSVDNANMDASDDTVDTDGEGLEAKRDLPLQHDNVVGSNATLDNNVPAPARGLGGIDSRAEGNRPVTRLRAGWTMVYHRCVELTDRNGGRVEHPISIEQIRH
ncbi:MULTISPECIES: DUF3005 domain-containing protein [unclassified Caballeronia]|uniref:DUF3005 domain-containing protein n=1 Tax=unclassified Caballeronia TaxID=2646786 RepID=UPI002866D4DB|nr:MULTISPECIES: DUF3005 domain-containing protein [unclassified Caballeronia]MDR5777343.1 DUF3005 domain-containing protein [Caballeronia sp. LZ002]MDR5852775.1 DUF3005 domain-containing protein [Caballeronia sp. LZ003]